jgi:RNA polymerase sigma-70 factor (ECF subfamily)
MTKPGTFSADATPFFEEAPLQPNLAPPTPTAEFTDEEVVARVLAGETRLFEILMRRHNQRVYRAARAILRDDGEAEDVMQDAYVRAYAHLREFEGRARFSTWLTRIAVHEALARSRRGRRFQPLDDQEQSMPSSPRVTPEELASDREVSAVLERAIDSLSDELRTVFVLRAVEEMSGAETAECLGIAEETVKTRLFRARARLQEALLEALEPTVPRAYSFHLSRCDRLVASVMSRLGAGGT